MLACGRRLASLAVLMKGRLSSSAMKLEAWKQAISEYCVPVASIYKRRMKFLAVVGAIVCFLPSGWASFIYDPVNAWTTFPYDMMNAPGYAISQLGLSHNYVNGVTDVDEYLELNPTHGYVGKFESNGYTLGGSFSVLLEESIQADGVIIWITGINSMAGFHLYGYNDPDDEEGVDLGLFALEQSNEAQYFNFAPIQANRFRVITAGVYGQRQGLAEIAFTGVPEPTSTCLAFLGTFLLVCRRGPHRRQMGRLPSR